jgi:hypothetical protein
MEGTCLRAAVKPRCAHSCVFKDEVAPQCFLGESVAIAQIVSEWTETTLSSWSKLIAKNSRRPG